MKVLQLCHKPPRPCMDGGCIAMDSITTGLLNAGVEVKILSIFTDKHWYLPQRIDPAYLEKTRFEAVYVDTSINVVDAFSSIITSDTYNVSRFFSPDFDIVLEKLLRKEKFDVVHIESLFMTPYIGTIRRFSRAVVVLRSHNIEYMIWDRIAEGSGNIKKFVFRYLAKKLRQFERNMVREMDGIIAITKEDQKKYQEENPLKPIISVPCGIDPQLYPFNGIVPEEGSVFHLGSMDWGPNVEGVHWLLEEVWPLVIKENPHIKLYLAGKGMPEDLLNLKIPGVIVLGEVESAKDFIRNKQVMCVPLLSGGGMRVKIIEGMALGKTIISTTIGAEGIAAQNTREIMLADDPETFAKYLVKFSSNFTACNEIGYNARKFVEDNYSNQLLALEIIKFYKNLMEK